MLIERFPEAINVTDKRPDNFLYIGLIKALFPQAKILHTVRDALDNCLSIYFLHLDPAMSYALDLMDVGHHYREYRRLMSHWQRLFGADILDVSYDSLVRDPKPQLEQILAFLGLDWDEGCVSVGPGRTVKTASVWQVREPLYMHSSGRSRHYAKQLDEASTRSLAMCTASSKSEPAPGASKPGASKPGSSKLTMTRVSKARRATPTGVSRSGGMSRAATRTSRATSRLPPSAASAGSASMTMALRASSPSSASVMRSPATRASKIGRGVTRAVARTSASSRRPVRRFARARARDERAGRRRPPRELDGVAGRGGRPAGHEDAERGAAHGARRRHALARDAAEDVGPRAVLDAVALALGEGREDVARRRRAAGLLEQIERVRRHANDERPLEAGDVVEEPAAARVHEQRRALQLEQQARPVARRLPARAQRLGPEDRERRVARVDRRIDDLAVGVARAPRVDEQLGRGVLVEVRRGVAHEVERLAQRPAPALVPALRRVEVAAAVALPAAEAVRAAPGRALVARPPCELELPGRRVPLDVGGEVRDLDAPLRRLGVRRVRERQIGELLVVYPQLPVGGAQDEARLARGRARRRGTRRP